MTFCGSAMHGRGAPAVAPARTSSRPIRDALAEAQLLVRAEGYWLIRLVPKGPSMPAAVIKAATTEEPGERGNFMERPAQWIGVIGGKAVHPEEVWTRRGTPISREAYLVAVGEIAFNSEHGIADARLEPWQPVDSLSSSPRFHGARTTMNESLLSPASGSNMPPLADQLALETEADRALAETFLAAFAKSVIVDDASAADARRLAQQLKDMSDKMSAAQRLRIAPFEADVEIVKSAFAPTITRLKTARTEVRNMLDAYVKRRRADAEAETARIRAEEDQTSPGSDRQSCRSGRARRAAASPRSFNRCNPAKKRPNGSPGAPPRSGRRRSALISAASANAADTLRGDRSRRGRALAAQRPTRADRGCRRATSSRGTSGASALTTLPTRTSPASGAGSIPRRHCDDEIDGHFEWADLIEPERWERENHA